MSTITTIAAGDLITNSRTDINTNFSDLNTDKIETSVLDTDTTLAANSDAKVATQKAVKAYVDAGSGVGATALTLIPYANYVFGTGVSNNISEPTLNVNTTLFVGQIVVPFNITVNKVSLWVASCATGGTLKVCLFTEDGQTQKISFTTATIPSPTTAVVTTTLGAAVTLSPGVYYIAVLPVSTASINVAAWGVPVTSSAALNGVSGKPILNGTVTVTASTMPSTITPASITDGTTNAKTMIVRLDN